MKLSITRQYGYDLSGWRLSGLCAETELKAPARDLGTEDRVTVTSFRADVPETMNLLDVVVHASISLEPFGRVIVEPMARRRKSGGRPFGDHRRRSNGFLVSPGDEEALASRVITLLEDRALSARITEAAYQDVERRFSPHIQAHEVLQIYDTVLRTKRRVSAPAGRADGSRRAAAMRKDT